jgi:hypothetical protein
MTNRVPLITALVVLLVPLVYVGSYFALVSPQVLAIITYDRTNDPQHPVMGSVRYSHYRFGFNLSEQLFWPLEQIDRNVRPEAWETDPSLLPPPFFDPSA